MPVKVIVLVSALFAVASCMPDHPCPGDLVFDDASALCYACPKEAKFKNYTCECPEGSTYRDLKCMKDGTGSSKDSGTAESDGGSDAGSGSKSDSGTAYETKNCKDYCSFVNTCIAGNAYATALSDIVKGLHADDAAACETSCKGDVGSAEATEPALVCFEAGEGSVMCDDPNPQTGLAHTFGLIGQCCGPNPTSKLCKSICTTLKANPSLGSMVPYCP